MISGELRPMLALAAPVVMAELGWVTMGIVDTIMVGSLGPGAIGAVGIASMLFFAVARVRDGAAARASTRSWRRRSARGALDECHRWLVDGVWLERPASRCR